MSHPDRTLIAEPPHQEGPLSVPIPPAAEPSLGDTPPVHSRPGGPPGRDMLAPARQPGPGRTTPRHGPALAYAEPSNVTIPLDFITNPAPEETAPAQEPKPGRAESLPATAAAKPVRAEREEIPDARYGQDIQSDTTPDAASPPAAQQKEQILGRAPGVPLQFLSDEPEPRVDRFPDAPSGTEVVDRDDPLGSPDIHSYKETGDRDPSGPTIIFILADDQNREEGTETLAKEPPGSGQRREQPVLEAQSDDKNHDASTRQTTAGRTTATEDISPPPPDPGETGSHGSGSGRNTPRTAEGSAEEPEKHGPPKNPDRGNGGGDEKNANHSTDLYEGLPTVRAKSEVPSVALPIRSAEHISSRPQMRTAKRQAIHDAIAEVPNGDELLRQAEIYYRKILPLPRAERDTVPFPEELNHPALQRHIPELRGDTPLTAMSKLVSERPLIKISYLGMAFPEISRERRRVLLRHIPVIREGNDWMVDSREATYVLYGWAEDMRSIITARAGRLQMKLESVDWGSFIQAQELTGLPPAVLRDILKKVQQRQTSDGRKEFNMPELLQRAEDAPPWADRETGRYSDPEGGTWIPESQIPERLGVSRDVASQLVLLAGEEFMSIIANPERAANQRLQPFYNQELLHQLEEQRQQLSKPQRDALATRVVSARKKPDTAIWESERDIAEEMGLPPSVVRRVLEEKEIANKRWQNARYYPRMGSKAKLREYIRQLPDEAGIRRIGGVDRAPIWLFHKETGLAVSTIRGIFGDLEPVRDANGVVTYEYKGGKAILKKYEETPLVDKDSGIYTHPEGRRITTRDVLHTLYNLSSDKVRKITGDMEAVPVRARNGMPSNGFDIDEFERRASAYLALPTLGDQASEGQKDQLMEARALATEFDLPIGTVKVILHSMKTPVRGVVGTAYPGKQARTRLSTFKQRVKIDSETLQYTAGNTVWVTLNEAGKRLGGRSKHALDRLIRPYPRDALPEGIAPGPVQSLPGRRGAFELTLYPLGELQRRDANPPPRKQQAKRGPVEDPQRIPKIYEQARAVIALGLPLTGKGLREHKDELRRHGIVGLGARVEKYIEGSFETLREELGVGETVPKRIDWSTIENPRGYILSQVRRYIKEHSIDDKDPHAEALRWFVDQFAQNPATKETVIAYTTSLNGRLDTKQRVLIEQAFADFLSSAGGNKKMIKELILPTVRKKALLLLESVDITDLGQILRAVGISRNAVSHHYPAPKGMTGFTKLQKDAGLTPAKIDYLTMTPQQRKKTIEGWSEEYISNGGQLTRRGLKGANTARLRAIDLYYPGGLEALQRFHGIEPRRRNTQWSEMADPKAAIVSAVRKNMQEHGGVLDLKNLNAGLVSAIYKYFKGEGQWLQVCTAVYKQIAEDKESQKGT